MTLNSKKTDFLLFGVFYCVMHGGILLIPNAIFWDDWVLYRMPSDVIFDTFRQAGAMFSWAGYLHVSMLSIGPWSYKILTFLLMFASGILLNLILERNAILTKESRFFVVLLFLVLPFNMARVALIDFPYTLCYFLFFFAWFLMDRHRIAALLLFFLSFNTNSLLVFYALPILDMMYRGGHLASPRSFLSFASRRPDFLLIPILFFCIKIYFFSPSGVYAGYNQGYSLKNLLPSIYAQCQDLAGIKINRYIFLLMLPFVFLTIRVKKTNAPPTTDSWENILKVLAIGVLTIITGAFPYWILGYVPTFNEWTSRHQLLLPLGTALVIVALLPTLKKPLNIMVILIVVAASLSYGLTTYYKFYVDWKKQTALINFLSKNYSTQNSNLVSFKDETKHLNALNRNYRSYEWNGLMEQAYGNQNHFGIEPEDLSKYRNGDFDKYFSYHYKANLHKRDDSAPAVLVQITLAKTDVVAQTFLNARFPEIVFTVSPIDLRNSFPDLAERGAQ